MNTFFWHFQLAALGDLDGLLRFVAGTLVDILYLLNNLVTLEDLSEHNMLSIEPAASY